MVATGCFPYGYRGHRLDLRCTDLQQNVGKAFESSSVCEGDFPNEQWWVFFQDPQLNRLIELSLSCHPDIKIAEARIRRAREEAIETRSALFPHLYLFGDTTQEKLSEFGSRTQSIGSLQYITEATAYLTSASYELDIWKKNRNLYYASLDEMFARIAELEEAKLLLSTTIASVYFDLQYNLELLRIAQGRLQAKQQLYDLLRQRFENGVISEFHLYETDTELQAIKDQIFQQQGIIQIDENALAALVGNLTCGWEGQILTEPAGNFDTPFPLPSSLPIDLLARRPDINALRCLIESACFNVEVARAAFYPKIDLFSFIGFTSFKLREFFRYKTLSWMGEATGLLPLFTAQKLEARLGIARENVEIAVETYNEAILTAVQQVSDSLTNLTIADSRFATLSQSVEDAKALYDLTYQRFENGVANRIAVLNGLENLYVQEGYKVEVQLDRFLAAVSLIKAIGGGYYDNLCP